MLSMRKKKWAVRIGLAVVVLGLLGGTGFMLAMKIKFADFQMPMVPANVVITKVAPVHFEDAIDAVGTAMSDESATITATVTETVKAIQVKEGEFAEAGTVIVELTDEEEQATLDEATRSYMRYNALTKKNLGSAADRDEALARMKVAQAQLDKRRIVAPFDGIVGLRQVSVGDLVVPGTVITTIDDIDPIKLDFSVPEIYLPALQNGMTIKARSEAWPDHIFEGKIYTIDPRIAPDTRSFRVRAELSNERGKLRPGLLMKVLIVRKAYDALAVPESAVLTSGDKKTVLVVGDADKVEEREVTTGLREPGYVEILSGLSAGDRVIIEGQMKTGAGATVKIVGERTVGEANAAALDYTIPRKKEAVENAIKLDAEKTDTGTEAGAE